MPRAKSPERTNKQTGTDKQKETSKEFNPAKSGVVDDVTRNPDKFGSGRGRRDSTSSMKSDVPGISDVSLIRGSSDNSRRNSVASLDKGKEKTDTARSEHKPADTDKYASELAERAALIRGLEREERNIDRQHQTQPIDRQHQDQRQEQLLEDNRRQTRREDRHQDDSHRENENPYRENDNPYRETENPYRETENPYKPTEDTTSLHEQQNRTRDTTEEHKDQHENGQETLDRTKEPELTREQQEALDKHLKETEKEDKEKHAKAEKKLEDDTAKMQKEQEERDKKRETNLMGYSMAAQQVGQGMNTAEGTVSSDTEQITGN